jgi:plasmid stabilization system protein ParE
MIVGILLAPEAEEQVRIIDAWWRKERTAAPHLFSEELAAVFNLLAAAPEAGRRYRHPTVVDVRRILLRSTRYHLLQDPRELRYRALGLERRAGKRT